MRTVKSIFSLCLLSTASWCAGIVGVGRNGGSADGCDAGGCDHAAAARPGMRREGAGGAVSGGQRDEILRRFQTTTGRACRVVGAVVGAEVSVVGQHVHVALDGVMSWAGSSTERTAARQSYTRCDRRERQKSAARMRRGRRRGSSSPE